MKYFFHLAMTLGLGTGLATSCWAQTGAASAAPAASVATPTPTATCSGPLNHVLPRLQDEQPQNLCQYAGRVVLVVNTASYCGFTPQYKGLEALYAQYKDRGLVVLGFPSNDFYQEPKGSQEIAQFCQNTYGVKFPMFAKSHVRVNLSSKSLAEDNPVFVDLVRATGEAPSWNFHKYLISRDGKTVRSYGTMVDPQNHDFKMEIEKLLNTK